ncbi:MAG: outer membrane protein assembly factor BamD [Deltaproteobacteria bacterium]|nr:outer membrane protein assembly factor BamD [Deltaproteobacteria bacterium]
MKFIKPSFYVMLVCLAISLTACLKTRAQLKSEQDQGQAESADDPRATPGAKPGRYDMEEVKNEVTRLSGKVEEMDHTQRTANFAELKEYTTRLDGRVAELEKNQVLMLSEIKALKDEKVAAAKEAATPPADLLTQGNQLLSEKRCDEAAEKFRSLLNKSAKGKEGSEAHFGLGEAEYCSKNYVKAIVQYSKVEEAFAKSPRIPASLYRIALSFQHLNKAKESKGFLNEVIDRYPKSPEAKKARAKVKE